MLHTFWHLDIFWYFKKETFETTTLVATVKTPGFWATLTTAEPQKFQEPQEIAKGISNEIADIFKSSNISQKYVAHTAATCNYI